MAAVEATASCLHSLGPAHHEALDASLTRVVHHMADAINARSFDPTSYPWTHLSDDFTAELFFAGWERNVIGRDAFVDYFESYIAAHAEYSVRIVDVVVTITKRTGRASIFANFESDGIPPGILRATVGMWEFAPIGDGLWRCTNYRCVPGINPCA